jgi:D-cysteine desulfhydrase
VRGARPEAYDGNLLLDRLLGAEVRYCTEAEFARVDEVMEALAAEVRAGGGRPYLIPEGGANEVGALGYLECAVELTEQIHHGAPRFDAVVISAFTGGSQAGLLLGKQLAGLPGEIVGVPIGRPAEQVREHVAHTMGAAIRRYGFSIDVPKTIHLLDGYQAAERLDAGDAELAVLVDLAREEGILLDPVYTARGFRGLVETVARDPKALGLRVCFVHTGGLFSLFPYRERLSRLIDREG